MCSFSYKIEINTSVYTLEKLYNLDETYGSKKEQCPENTLTLVVLESKVCFTANIMWLLFSYKTARSC